MRIGIVFLFRRWATFFPGSIRIERAPHIITGRDKIGNTCRLYGIQEVDILYHEPRNLSRLLVTQKGHAMMSQPTTRKINALANIEHGPVGIQDEIDCNAVRQALALSKGYG